MIFFRGTVGVGTHFYVLRTRTCFWRYRGCPFPFSCFALLDLFFAVPSASSPVFMFCAPDLIFGGPEGDGFRFNVLRAGNNFRRYGGRRVPISCFALLESFLTVPSVSGPVFKYRGYQVPLSFFCSPGLAFGSTEGIGSRFDVLRSASCFSRYRGRQVPFSSFALQDTFSTVPRASGPIFMFCVHGFVFGVPRVSRPIFMFCALEHVFGGTEGVQTRFHVLRSRTYFLRCRVRRVLFSCFVRPGLIFDGPEGDGFRFHVLRAENSFWWYGGRRVPISCFARLDSFLAKTRASAPFFDGIGDVGSRFQVLRARTHFRRYRGRPVPFSCFALPDSFSAVPGVFGPVFMFCAPGHVFGGAECVGSRFHVLCARARFWRSQGRRVPFSCFARRD
jgi:hypothetical protein